MVTRFAHPIQNRSANSSSEAALFRLQLVWSEQELNLRGHSSGTALQLTENHSFPDLCLDGAQTSPVAARMSDFLLGRGGVCPLRKHRAEFARLSLAHNRIT